MSIILKKIIAMRDQIDLSILKQLMRLKFVNIRSELIEKTTNIYIWAGCTIFVMGYLMQSFGLAKDFGPFQLASILAVIGLFELYGNAATLLADFETDRVISYYLTVPSSAITVLAGYVFHYLFVSFVMSIALIPLGKLLLLGQLKLSDISWIKFLLFLFLVNLLWATMAFLLASYLESIEKLGIAWCRIIFPLWFLGGFQFSWTAINSVSPILSYGMLLNPVIYATEGMRAVILGAGDAIPLWICSIVLTFMLIITAFWSYKALKKRLDFV